MNDAGHEPQWVKSVSGDEKAAIIVYEKEVSKVISFHVSPDETFAKKGIVAGASVGLSSAVIKFGPGEVKREEMEATYGNFWVTGIFQP